MSFSSAAGGANSGGGSSDIGGVTSTDVSSATGGVMTGGTSNAGGTTLTGGTLGAGGMNGVGGADGKKMFFGNIPTNGVVRDDFATYWQQIIPENEGKWGLIQPTSQDQFNWSVLDPIYKYADDHHVIFKEHNFFCGNQQPTWVTADNVATAGPAWVKAFCQRYPNTKLIDVVNEPSHFTPTYVNGMGGFGTTGYDWVITAFEWARQYCPNAILIINDYNIIEYDNDHLAFMTMLKALLAAGAKIDAIGAQGHDAYLKSTSKVKLRIDDLASTGLPVYITEYDINLADDAQQMNTMADQIQMLWDHPNVKGFTYWGYIVGTTWRANAGLVNADGTFRPAMTWLQNFMKSH
jgi:endo-1,4-beta-xylanase